MRPEWRHCVWDDSFPKAEAICAILFIRWCILIPAAGPREALGEAVALARRLGYVFLATADAAGWPHLASAGRLDLGGGEPSRLPRLVVAEWFCPGTMANLEQNRRVAIVIWDAASDIGHQLLGEVEEVRDLAMLDGYVPGEEEQPYLPQSKRELLIRVDRVLAFSRGPHSDIEEYG